MLRWKREKISLKVKEGHEYKQAGLTIAVTSPVVSTAQSMGHSIKRSREVKNEKLKQLHQMKAAYDSLELAQNAAKCCKHGFQLRKYDGR